MIRKSFRIFSLLVAILVIGFLIWFFFIGSVPNSYTECLQTHTNDYTRNDLLCSFSPRTPAEFKTCKEKGGISGPICLIAYYNPNFIFPKDLNECLQKITSTNNEFCDINISKNHAYDTQIANKLYSECLKNGGLDSMNSCTMHFQK